MSKADRPDHPKSKERFNEDAATYAVRGEGKPDLDAGVAAIRNVVKTLPARPGVYRMQDARGDVLYVGKAKSLRKRLASYRVANPDRLRRRHLRLDPVGHGGRPQRRDGIQPAGGPAL